ncbi:hypothetical protein [uncultured Cohaesibacter sp.]|uniref:hypothetical protein n=1 Tax=uncultured Cohaesibacter sp. TaxID=1002546 RepID=UPI0029C8CE57|nr:hypothetical protein [uncultured Cohaesibacter sp.]
MEPQPDRLEFDAENARLTGFYYAPEGRPRANLVLHGATGVPQRYSRHFASWAASQGIGVLTYDYRDFGVSCQGHPQNSKAVFHRLGVPRPAGGTVRTG